MYKIIGAVFSIMTTYMVAVNDDDIARYFAKSEKQYIEWNNKIREIQAALQRLVDQQEKNVSTEQKAARMEQSIGGSYMKVVD